MDCNNKNTHIKNEMQCPFTWEMDESLVLDTNLNNELFDITFTEQPVIAFMNNVTLAFISTVKNELETAVKFLIKASHICENIDYEQPVHRNVSKNVLQHIWQASLYFVHKVLIVKLTEPKEETTSMMVISSFLPQPLDDPQAIETVCTLKACQSMAWYNFKTGNESAYWLSLAQAKAASDDCPSAPLFHFLVGRSLLHPLCFQSLSNWPFVTELNHLQRAYELTNCPFIGIHIEEVFREIGDTETAELVRLAIHKSQPFSVWVKLKLAMAFIQCDDLERAREIIEMVHLVQPNHKMLGLCKEAFWIKQTASGIALCGQKSSMVVLAESLDDMKL
ncbi:uncharacterized protein LOC106637274 [Copidosoma floridanum]|uniref:uncharacterized protein LOC106637274 n=1 Tax=Copidosoma floridanum TaxID=29053 RepID=UPI0006C9C837|nr:uncharacterized protein LOC106637274 [Copidosoma floridanum]